MSWGFVSSLLFGLGVSLGVGLAAMILCLGLGLVGARAKLSTKPFLRGLAGTYTTVIRGVPELVLIITLYYGLPTLVQNLVRATLNAPEFRLDFNPYATGVVVLGLIYGAFMTEVIKGAFLAVPNGQSEASRALGLSSRQTYWKIILPQVWRFALPGIGNIWMVLIKATALVSVIQLQELMFWARRAGNATREPFTYLLIAALLYLLVTFVSERFFAYAETRANKGLARPQAGGL